MKPTVRIDHHGAVYDKYFNYRLTEALVKSGFKIVNFFENPETVVYVAPVCASSGLAYLNRITVTLLESQPVVQVLLPEDDISEPRWTGMVHAATDQIVTQLRLLQLKG